MRKTEKYARVIDFIPESSVNGPLLHLVGEDYFVLFNAEPTKKDYDIGERLYVGKGPRDGVGVIFGILKYSDLTGPGKSILPDVLRQIILDKEEFYVNFFNYAPAITNRMHSLELLPGIGKKHRDKILEERAKEKFKSFKDIEKRTKIHDPVGLIVERIILEMRGHDRHRLFYGKNKFYTPETLEKLKKLVR